MGANKPNMEFFDFAPAPAGFKWVRDKENGEWKLIQILREEDTKQVDGKN